MSPNVESLREELETMLRNHLEGLDSYADRLLQVQKSSDPKTFGKLEALFKVVQSHSLQKMEELDSIRDVKLFHIIK